jgi:hypothetical protein
LGEDQVRSVARVKEVCGRRKIPAKVSPLSDCRPLEDLLPC